MDPTSILTLDFRSYLAYSPFKTVIFVKLVMSYFDFFSLKIQPLFNRETTQCGFLDLCWPLDFPQINCDIYGRHTHTHTKFQRETEQQLGVVDVDEAVAAAQDEASKPLQCKSAHPRVVTRLPDTG